MMTVLEQMRELRTHDFVTEAAVTRAIHADMIREVGKQFENAAGLLLGDMQRVDCHADLKVESAIAHAYVLDFECVHETTP